MFYCQTPTHGSKDFYMFGLQLPVSRQFGIGPLQIAHDVPTFLCIGTFQTVDANRRVSGLER